MNTVNVLIASNQSSDDFSKLRRMLPENIQIIIPEKGTEEELVQLATDVDVIVCIPYQEKSQRPLRDLSSFRRPVQV